ncbi:MAG TPA: translation elongation factor Ts, partial [Acidimicrobiales bacterium]|nr:translation elongation factor Ts [Acidimicrobiales bacterium]
DTGGDSEAAMKLLQEKGLAAMAKRSDRDNNQGAVAISRNGNVAAMVELKCETDFVAKSPDFVNLANDLAALVVESGEDALTERKTEIDAIGVTLKENIALGRVVRFEATGVLDTYLHVQSDRGVNGVLVELDGGDAELAHDVALTIAFNKPSFLTRDEVPPEVVTEQREIAEAKARNEGKPEAALPKIIEGMITGFFKQQPGGVLLDQPFAKDDKKSVEAALGGAKIVRFAQVVVG